MPFLKIQQLRGYGLPVSIHLRVITPSGVPVSGEGVTFEMQLHRPFPGSLRKCRPLGNHQVMGERDRVPATLVKIDLNTVSETQGMSL
jgi:hypothetical protein